MTIIVIAASISGFWGVVFLLLAVKSPEKNIEDRIKLLTADNKSQEPKEKISWKNYLALLARFTPQKWAKRLDLELIQSGIPLTGGEFIIIQSFLLVALILAAMMLFAFNKAAILLPLIGILLPRLYIGHCQNVRTRKFNNQLSDVLLILSNSLRAGFSLLQAMDMISKEMPDPISAEIKITLREMTYGESTESALENFAQRIKSRDLDLMVTAILIQRQIGGNLAEILVGIHETIQDRLKIQGEVKTLTAQGKLSGYVISFIPFAIALIIAIIQPDYLGELIHSSVGIILILAGITSQLFGFWTINRITNIKI